MVKQDEKKRLFTVDARILLSLGRESIKDQTTAVVELVKNAYDADAENVEVELSTSGEQVEHFLRIADDGDGMSTSDIDNKWLRIGFSEKRKKKISAKGRRETGEKGVGRLSADRLGTHLELRSKQSSGSPVGISVNWDAFDVDGLELSGVPVNELPDGAPTVSKRDAAVDATGGTEIIIRGLRQEWGQLDISSLEDELSTLVASQVAKSDFVIWLKTPGANEFTKVASAFESAAELEFLGKFDKSGRLTYEVTGKPIKYGQKRRSIRTGKVPWEQLADSKDSLAYEIGPVNVRLAFYLRTKVDLASGLSIKQLRDYLDTQGGIRVYRDDIRVKPYGDPRHPEGDWLGLSERKVQNPAGAARKDFRFASNQLVGSVEIGRDSNPSLSDSASREGLIHGDSFSSLKNAVYACIGILEGIYHTQFVENLARPASAVQTVPAVAQLKTDIASIQRTLVSAERSVGLEQSAKLIKDSMVRLTEVGNKVAVAEREYEELATQSTVYRGLATVGIASAVFGHETETALAQAKLSTNVTARSLRGKVPDLELALEELGNVRDAVERIQVWGQFALTRVKKEKRRKTKVDLSRTVSSIVEEMLPLFEASTISLERELASDVSTVAFAMDVEAMVVNLLTNAYHHAAKSRRNRRVLIELIKASKGAPAKLIISDSGPGIAAEHMNLIWTPLFSTRMDQRGRPTGTGLGLTIVQSVAQEIGATVVAKAKGRLGGAEFSVAFS